MREDFEAIVSGWTFDDLDGLTERIEFAAEWTTRHGPLLPGEEATIRAMIESQVARGLERDGLCL